MKKIVIIGGGIAGLSAGCYAKMNDFDAHIYEMHNLPGGLCTSWKRRGYTFDICIQWLMGTSPDSPYHKIWQELESLKNKYVYYNEKPWKVFLKGQVIDFYNDPDRLASSLKEIAPEDSKIIDELSECVKKFYQINQISLTKPNEFLTLFDMIKMMKEFIPLMKFVKKYSKISIDKFTDLITNPNLKRAFKYMKLSTSIEDFIAIPFILSTRKSGFPKGGSLPFAKSIEQRLVQLGGEIHYGKKIKKVLVVNNKATGILLEDGSEIEADIVISAADGYHTIFQLLDGQYMSKKIKHIYNTELLAPSLLQVSIGINSELSSEKGFVEYLYELENPIVIEGKNKKCLLIRNYSFDPSFAPQGKSTLTVTFPSDYSYWEKIYSDKEKYHQEKNNVEKGVLFALEKVIPEIRGKIEVVDVATPVTLNRYTNNWNGAITGFARPYFLNIPRTLPKLKKFYMTGQWIGNTGLADAAKSGRDCLEVICKKEKKEFITTKL
ncbi:MAG: NAD(P)/FAD-dependent oxidoreductase [Spirochaetes bacterium]|nr:NAD(P)/FAD-dependent oxidoreductase [Spirochaetota bacterium]